MLEIGPQHRLEYRQEVLIPFFKYVASTDTCYVIGAASMGKTRLLDLMMKQEVQKHYLKEDADKHWLIRVDMNRMQVNDPAWAFYELLVSSILLNLYNHENTENLVVELTKLDSEIIQKRDPLLALRFFELIVKKLCQVYELKLCFLLDEFDEAYKTVRIRDGRLFHAAALEDLRGKLRAHARTANRIDVAEFKRIAGVWKKQNHFNVNSAGRVDRIIAVLSAWRDKVGADVRETEED